MQPNETDLIMLFHAVYFYVKQYGFRNLPKCQQNTYKKLNKAIKRKLAGDGGYYFAAITSNFDKLCKGEK